MVRYLLIAVAAIFCAESASAQIHIRHRQPTFATGFASPAFIDFGVGGYPADGVYRYGRVPMYSTNPYPYDPYVRGSFRAPDLLDDPFFRERTRHQSHFPGRRRRGGGIFGFRH